MRRSLKPPLFTYYLRSSLNESSYASIDSALKDIKICSRRLQILVSSHRDDLQILERLYYKGRNQHRSALFWKRVVEIRRYSCRLDEAEIFELLERFRYSFFGEGVHNPKILKGPWTHVPSPNYLTFVSERLIAYCALVRKTYDCCLKTYQFFLLVMQSGAFVQLLLSFTGIVSRIGFILSEVLQTLQQTLAASHRIQEASNPSAAQISRSTDSSASSYARKPVADEYRTTTPIHAVDDEDLGISVEHQIPVPNITYLPAESGKPFTTFKILKDSDQRLPTLETDVFDRVALERSDIILKPKKHIGHGENRKKRRKKKDEIDDIFASSS